VPEPKFSVVVPLFNEQFAVAGTIVDLREYFEARGDSYEILLVDNASTDATRSHAEPLLEAEKIRLLVNDANLGKGYSVRRGMLEARGEIRLHCDADCAPSLASLPKMLELLESNDLVVGSRLAAGAELGQRQTLPRRFIGRGFQQCCRAILSEPTRDLFCGFKLWRGEAAEDVFERLSLDGWTYDAEAIAMARALGYRVSETGIVWTDREGSRLQMGRILIPVIRELLAAKSNVARQVGSTARGGRSE
jgi:glycosyltransferase involved in cell wall biosynthesis